MTYGVVTSMLLKFRISIPCCEFQCQSQLKTLYADGIEGSQLEFAAYNLLCVILHSNNYRELLSSMSRLVAELLVKWNLLVFNVLVLFCFSHLLIILKLCLIPSRGQFCTALHILLGCLKLYHWKLSWSLCELEKD